MATIPITLERSDTLCAFDADLPFLASEAALDLDNLRLGTSSELDAVRQLAQRLKNSVANDSVSQKKHLALDPATLTVLGEAMNYNAANGETSQKVDILLEKAGAIAEFLSGDEITKESKEFDSARLFCVALSRAALAYQKSLRDLRPTHPFRR